MSQFITYIVGQGDTIESISQTLLRSDQSDSIIQLNQLRYPYISDNPYYQYGMPKGTLQLANTLAAGSSTVTFNNNNSLQINFLDTIFFQDFSNDHYESVIVQSETTNSDGTVTVTFQSSLLNAYYVSSTITLFVNQQNITTKVLKTGDTIYLPYTAPNVYSTSQGNSDIYGTDISLDQDGFIKRTSNGWDIVSGLENLGQAIQMRWRTPLGALPGEVDYGNEMFDLLGETNTDYYLQLSKTYAEQSVRQDPRVSDVSDVTITTNQGEQLLSATIQPVNSISGFLVAANLPIGGNS